MLPLQLCASHNNSSSIRKIIRIAPTGRIKFKDARRSSLGVAKSRQARLCGHKTNLIYTKLATFQSMKIIGQDTFFLDLVNTWNLFTFTLTGSSYSK